MSTEEEYIDLEAGPPPPLQRMNTSDTEKMVSSRRRFDDLLRADREKLLTQEETTEVFNRLSPEKREAREREEMFEQDPLERRNIFETDMEPWGQGTGGRRRKTHRKRHSKKKTYKKYSKTSRKHKKSYKKRSMKRPKK